MSFSVSHVSDQLVAYQFFSWISIRQHLLKGIQDNVNDLDVLLLVVSADVITLAQLAFLLNHVNCFRMIVYIEPVTDIFTVTVYRQRFSLQCIVDHQRDQLLRELERSVVVAAACDVAREFIGIEICFGQHISACFTC